MNKRDFENKDFTNYKNSFLGQISGYSGYKKLWDRMFTNPLKRFQCN